MAIASDINPFQTRPKGDTAFAQITDNVSRIALAPQPLSFGFCVFAFSLAAIAGAVLIVFPGGLGVTEASMGGLLAREYSAAGLAAGAAQASAAAATILTRLCTLWFAVAVGLVATALFYRRHGARAPLG